MMFHIGRSGSRVLGDMLQQHSAIHWDHEAFVHQLQQARRAGQERPSGDPVELLRRRMALAPLDLQFGTEAKFFHLRLFGCSFPAFVAQAAVLGFSRFVVLKRRNYLRKIVSSLIAHQTHKWHHRQETPASLTPVYIDVDQVDIDWTKRPLLDHLYQFEANFLEATAVLSSYATLHLTYETDILADPAVGYGKICRFLELTEEEVVVRYGRSNPYPLRTLIQNYDDVACTLQNTPFEWMVQDETN